MVADVLVGVVAFVGLAGGWGSSAAIWIGAAACLIGFAAIVIGVTALPRLPHSTELGGGLAITGMVLGALSIVAAPVLVAVAGLLSVVTINFLGVAASYDGRP